VDIYVTGSNSRLLSSEFSTYLAGRYVAFHIMTLSFREYLLFHDLPLTISVSDRKTEFLKYLRMGGFPAIHTANYDYNAIYKIVYDIYSSVILRDTVQRHSIRNVEMLERVVKFVFDNIGNKLNAKNIADYFKSQQRKVDINTIYNYLNALDSAFVIQRIPRYDIKGKEILQTNEKYFVSDLSLIYSVMGYRDRLIGGMLENLVCMELKRRGYEVYVGKQDEKEVDFVAIRREEKIYVQVTYQLGLQATIDREFAPLLAIDDHYPKYVVSMDDLWQDNIEGVKHRHIADFLLDEW
ncbi:MAG: ATP-binding protein, partial [Bacteroides sp.]|nr:ATP-binding protein [Bacteroides sp.]